MCTINYGLISAKPRGVGLSKIDINAINKSITSTYNKLTLRLKIDYTQNIKIKRTARCFQYSKLTIKYIPYVYLLKIS